MRIGVIRGGVSDEYPVSLKTGAAVLAALKEEGYEAIDLLLDRDGILHIRGIPATLEQVAPQVDLVWNALHGRFGESGDVQQLFEAHHIPYTGARALASALAHNKELAKARAREVGMKTARTLLINPLEETGSVSATVGRIYRSMAPPWVVKPLTGGSSLHTHVVRTPLELAQVVEESLSRGDPFLVEQYIFGKEASVSVVEGFRNRDLYHAPAVAVPRSETTPFFSFDLKNSDTAHQNISASGFVGHEEKILSEYARAIHQSIGAEDYSESQFILEPKGAVYFLEINTSPKLHHRSLFSQALARVGSGIRELVRHVVGRRLGKGMRPH